MILRALKHNDEATVAQALDVNVDTIRKKRDLLNGICKEAVDLFKDRRVSPKVFSVLRKMKPVRQAEVAQLMRSSNLYSGRFAAALLAGTGDEMLVKHVPDRDSIQPEQRRRIEAETDTVLQNMQSVEAAYGTDLLALTIARRFVSTILSRSRVREYLAGTQATLLVEIETLLEQMDKERG